MHLTVPIEVKMDMDEIIARLKKDDFVPVVRCKDCKNGNLYKYTTKYVECVADVEPIDRDPYFFCASGRRRGDGEEA